MKIEFTIREDNGIVRIFDTEKDMKDYLKTKRIVAETIKKNNRNVHHG